MNPAEEQQAIARIHRMGQTKNTFVHRFIVGGTIEEKIQLSIDSSEDKWSNKKITLNDLKNLFEIDSVKKERI